MKLSPIFSCILALTAFAAEPESRKEALLREAGSIRGAARVSIHEFAGYPSRHHILSTVDLSVEDSTELATILTGSEFAIDVDPLDSLMCYVPHHSVVVTPRSGEPYRIDVCFGCRKLRSPFPPPHGQERDFNAAAQARLRAFFVRLHIPVRPSLEYGDLDYQYRSTAK